MKTIAKVNVGVDISKDFLDVFVEPTKIGFRVENSNDGISSLIDYLSGCEVQQVVCEATGGYEKLMKETLKGEGFFVWCVQPKRLYAFRRAKGIKIKTDKVDAKMIALFASNEKCEYAPISHACDGEKIKAFVSRQKELTDMIAKEKQRAKHPACQFYSGSIRKTIAFLKTQIDEIDEKITEIVELNNEWKNGIEYLQSIPGVGRKTALALLAYVPELGKIENKKIAALLGVAPFINQSGASKGFAKIQDGRFFARRQLYMATLSAIRHAPFFKQFYEQLINRGKKPKVAICATMRKLIIVANVLIREKRTWRP